MSSSEPENTTSSASSEAVSENSNMKTSWMSLALAGIAAVVGEWATEINDCYMQKNGHNNI
jgi:hypothetical protein